MEVGRSRGQGNTHYQYHTEKVFMKIYYRLALCNAERTTMIDKYNEAGITPTEIEADGFITRIETLERINANKAKPLKECAYPRCENCDKYHGHYCTVPMVISKQVYLTTGERLQSIEKVLAELESLVYGEILGSEE